MEFTSRQADAGVSGEFAFCSDTTTISSSLENERMGSDTCFPADVPQPWFVIQELHGDVQDVWKEPPMKPQSIPSPGFSHPDALASEDIDASARRETDPLSDGAEDGADTLNLDKPPVEKLASTIESSRVIVGHEELRRSVNGGEGATLGVPGRVDGRISGEEPNLIRQESEFFEGGRDVTWLSHHRKGLFDMLAEGGW